MPYYQMGIHPGMPGAPVEAVQSYHPGPPPGAILYQPMMPPPNYPQHIDTQSQAHRFPKQDTPHDPQSRHQHQHQSTMSSTSPVVPSHSPTFSRIRPPDNKSPTSATAKNSPLSLASITSPFNPDHQSKNYHAQTLMLGERLRLGLLAPEGPAALICGRTRPRRRRQPRRPRYTSITIPHPAASRRFKCNRGRLGVSATLYFSPVSHRRATRTETV